MQCISTLKIPYISGMNKNNTDYRIGDVVMV